MREKIDMKRRTDEFIDRYGEVNPVAQVILLKQLWKVECKCCGELFECAEGSQAFKMEVCADCINDT
jgi:hypothetical protein